MAAVYYQNPWSANMQILPADTSNFKTLATLAAFTKITSIIISSSDTSARDLQFAVSIGGVDYPLITTSIPANSGNVANVAPTLLLRNAFWELNGDNFNNRVLELPSGAVLKMKTLTTVTSTRSINITAVGETL